MTDGTQQPQRPDGHQPVVLVVDDTPDNRFVLEEVLRAGLPGCRVMVAGSGEQALTIAASEALDVALVDVQMPGMSGVELCRRLKASAATAHVCVLLITSHQASPQLLAQGLEAGAEDFIHRPIDNTELLARVRVSLRARRAEEQLRSTNEQLRVLVESRTRDLHFSKELLRSVLETAVDAVIATDPLGLVCFWNPAAERMFQRSERDAAGLPLDVLLRGNGSERIGLRRDAATFPIELTAGPWTTDEGLFHTYVLRDVTARKEAEQELRWQLRVNALLADLSKSLLATETDTAGVASLVLDASRALTGCGDGWVSRMEAGKIELLARGGRNATSGPLAEWADQALRPRADGRTPGLLGHTLAGGETPLLTNDAGSHPAAQGLAVPKEVSHFLAVPVVLGQAVFGQIALADEHNELSEQHLRAAEQVARLFAMVLDRDRHRAERRELEDQLRQGQKMEAVGRLAGGIAHDLNNVLTVVAGMGELVYASLPSQAPAREHMAEILKAGKRATDLTRQLLAFSRRQILTPQIVRLDRTVSDLQQMLMRLIGEDVELVVQTSQPALRVWVDPGQIEQVILNLALNARDAMPSGGRLVITAALTTLEEELISQHGDAVPPGRYAELSVSDSGAGMDDATVARIFEPFFTTKEPGKGTGLGLATVYGIVRQSGGFIWLRTAPGQGTNLRIFLPLHDGPGESHRPSPSTPPPASSPAPAPGTETVLLVEDDPSVRQVVGQQLMSCGYRVVEADGPLAALAAAQRHGGPLHLLLTDVVMPGMSGRQLAERMLVLRPGTKVLYMSGHTDDALVRYGVRTAATAFLQKPFTRNALASKVREVLEGP